MKKHISIDPEVKALIFDIDGTLADTMPAHYNAFKKVLGKYEIPFSHDMFLSFAGVPVGPQMKILKERFHPDNFDPEKVAIEKEEEYFKTIHLAKPLEVVYEVLLRYHGKLPIACGTGGDRRIAGRTLEVIGAIDKVDAVVTCEDVANGKPAPDTFLECARLLNTEPGECLVFEDADPGIQAAIAAGMKVIDVRKYL